MLKEQFKVALSVSLLVTQHHPRSTGFSWTEQPGICSNQKDDPNRLIVEVGNRDENITKYLDDNGYEVETDKLDAEKTTYFPHVDGIDGDDYRFWLSLS